MNVALSGNFYNKLKINVLYITGFSTMRYIQNKGNVMKAGIFLRKGLFISKNHIVSYSFSDDRVNLNMVNGDIISI